MSGEELAAVIAALQSLSQGHPEKPQPEVSAWKRAARMEGVGVR